MTFMKWSACSFGLIAFLLFQSACQKDDVSVSPVAQNDPANFFQTRNGDGGNSDTTDFEDMCFEFVFPLTILFPDGSTETVNSDNALESAIEAWEDANPNSEDYPTFSFPVEVIQDSETLTIFNERDLCELFHDCEEEFEDEDYIDYLCFDIEFPVTVLLPGGGSAMANDFEVLENIFRDWFENNPGDTVNCPSFAYPITIHWDDSTSVQINSDEELEEAIDECEDEFEEFCFDFIYPINVVFPDGGNLAVNDLESLEDAFDNWYDQNPESEDDPTLQFPVTVKFEDGTEQTANSEEQLEDLFDLCDEE